jgi:tRNA uridine 5-carboxymethylaminomethyl modification enzyme
VLNSLFYVGYISKQQRLLAEAAHLDELEIPEDFDYRTERSLSTEAREKLERMRPENLGQASRIDGVRAGDLAVLSVLVRRWRAAAEQGDPA